MVSDVFPPLTPFFTGFATGQLVVPQGAGPFSIQALAGSVTINGRTLGAGFAWDCPKATATPLVVGATGGLTSVVVAYMTQ